MKAVCIIGSPQAHGSTSRVVERVMAGLTEGRRARRLLSAARHEDRLLPRLPGLCREGAVRATR